MSGVVSILIIEIEEADEAFLRDVVDYVAQKAKGQVSKVSLTEGRGSRHLTFPGLEILVKEQKVLSNGQPITLSHYEFFTLLYLAEHPGWVFSKQQIYEAVWKEPGESCGAAVASVISQLRRKLWPRDFGGGHIRTVRNSGYKFEP